MGANIPGKKVENMMFSGGVPFYKAKLVEETDSGYAGLDKGKVAV